MDGACGRRRVPKLLVPDQAVAQADVAAEERPHLSRALRGGPQPEGASVHIPRFSAIALVAIMAAVLFAVGGPGGRVAKAAPVGTTVSRWQTSQAGDRLTRRALGGTRESL